MVIQYIMLSSISISLFYLGYRLVFRQNNNFRYARIFLMISVGISLLLPLSESSIETGLNWPYKKTRQVIVAPVNAEAAFKVMPAEKNELWQKIIQLPLLTIAMYIYCLIAGALLLRIIFMLIMLAMEYRKSFKVHLKDCILLYNHRFRTTFSFFRLVFVQEVSVSEQDLEQIIAHEKVHVNQCHSLDILVIELLAAVMWFNPLIWMMKNSIQLVHEYLADNGALDTGIDKSRYQALLINQVAEERLVMLSSSFNQSLIKKRIIMMTKSKTQKNSFTKLLALMPLSLSLFLLMAIFNGSVSQDVNASETGIITKNLNSLVAATSEPTDTIIKKTITKKISKEHPGDTIITETEEIITGEDAMREKHMMQHEGGDENVSVKMEHRSDGYKVNHTGETHTVIVHVDGDKVEHEEISGDTIVFIRHNGDGDNMEKKIIIRENDGMPSNVLYLVDGKPYHKLIESLDATKIESMNVIKGADVAKYTKEPYDAVIDIKMKK